MLFGCRLKHGQNSQFYVTYILPQLKKSNGRVGSGPGLGVGIVHGPALAPATPSAGAPRREGHPGAALGLGRLL